MGLAEEVGFFLDAQSTRFTLGSTSAGALFLNYLPDEPNTASTIVESGGLAPQRIFAGSLVAWENARIQLVCRSSASTRARGNIDAAWTILEGVTNSTLSGKYYLRISAVQSPFLLERDAGGRVHFAANFDIMRRP